MITRICAACALILMLPGCTPIYTGGTFEQIRTQLKDCTEQSKSVPLAFAPVSPFEEQGAHEQWVKDCMASHGFFYKGM